MSATPPQAIASRAREAVGQVPGSRSAALWEIAHLHVASVRVYRGTTAGPLHPPGYPPLGEIDMLFFHMPNGRI